MATGGENFSESIGSEDLLEVMCDPCQEDWELHKAVGMCSDCQYYLCQECFDYHKIVRQLRKHKLLDKDTMIQNQVTVTKDRCTEKCGKHEDKLIEYCCTNHNHLGCSACITLYHRSCGSVRYIPHIAKDLANNERYTQVENQWISVEQRSKKCTEINKQKTESVHKDCSVAVETVQTFRKEINEALDKVTTDLIRQCETMKSEEIEKLASTGNLFKTVQVEMNNVMAMKETYQRKQQNCNMYTLMMKSKDKLKLAENTIKEVEKKQSHINSQIKFVANKDTLNYIRLSESLGKMLASGISTTARPEKTETNVSKKEHKTIASAEYIEDIDIKEKNGIIGLVVLHDTMLVTTDYHHTKSVHSVDANTGQIITSMTLHTGPWDVAMITTIKVAVTLPDYKKVVMVNVTDTVMTVDRTLDVNGQCYGVDFSDDKLAVTFSEPGKVEVLTLQGRVLYTITNDQQGHGLFNDPWYVAFDQDITSLYVSNYSSDNLVNVKFDGSVAGTYTDIELLSPMAVFTDRSGHVYVCGKSSCNVHQITQDCRKVQVLLTDLNSPMSLSYHEANYRLYVGGYAYPGIMVYNVILGNK